MQHPLQISRKIEYGLRAMSFLASVPGEQVVPFKEIARRMQVPQSFLAKIMKVLVSQGLVRATRGAHGGYSLMRPAREITFLEVIEAVEGPLRVSLCESHTGSCHASDSCTMYGVWMQGREKMLEVFRAKTLDTLAMSELGVPSSAPGRKPVALGLPPRAAAQA